MDIGCVIFDWFGGQLYYGDDYRDTGTMISSGTSSSGGSGPYAVSNRRFYSYLRK